MVRLGSDLTCCCCAARVPLGDEDCAVLYAAVLSLCASL